MSHSHNEPATQSQEPKKANKLAEETSTYLRQHAYNPVEWYPWGEEALARSRNEDKPILLSIGYSACHWCHVMEHESFEDETTAAIMNRHFINIKVDREERPDLDEIYMKSVQLLTGHGGWPMTVFLTPALKPFFAGTYFPPQDRHGIPSFRRVLLGVKTAWESQREEVDDSASDITKHLSMLDKAKTSETQLDKELLEKAIDPLIRVFDRTWGGFGGAPKFPHTASLSLAMRRIKADPETKSQQTKDCKEMLQTTLDRMAWGGMHDQLGGGFARYSVDRRWLIPHFEKMLYDNALIPRNYLDGYLLTGRKYWLDVARDSLEFVLRELGIPQGGFYCSLDADSEGEEGKYYVWKPEQIEEILGQKDGAFICEVYGISKQGNFEHGSSAANFPEGHEECFKRLKLSEEAFWQKLNPLKEKLLTEREKRVRPGRDDKMLTSWTSLMISCLTDGYRVTGDAKYLGEAIKSADFILTRLMKDGRLLRTFGRDIAKLNGYLEDYAYTIQALLDLAACDANSRWLRTAVSLNKFVLQHFWDNENGGFYYTSDDHEELIVRTKHFYDGSTPSASSVSVMNLIRLERLTGETDFGEKAAQTMSLYTPYYHKAPDQFSNMLCALDAYLAEPTEIAVIFDQNSEAQAKALCQEIYRHYLPNAVIVLGNLSDEGMKDMAELSPLLKDRPMQNGQARVYVCRNFACQTPVSDTVTLAAQLKAL